MTLCAAHWINTEEQGAQVRVVQPVGSKEDRSSWPEERAL
jgi:hypothetical protein